MNFDKLEAIRTTYSSPGIHSHLLESPHGHQEHLAPLYLETYKTLLDRKLGNIYTIPIARGLSSPHEDVDHREMTIGWPSID